MSEGKKTLDCNTLLQNLRVEWKPFPILFQELNESQRTEYLQQQGFGSFHDLLAHIIGWWEECTKVVNSILDLTELPRKEYDIDAFNLASQKHFQDWDEEDLLIHFNNIRKALVTMVVEIPPEGLDNPRISSWLDACLIEHYQDHKIS